MAAMRVDIARSTIRTFLGSYFVALSSLSKIQMNRPLSLAMSTKIIMPMRKQITSMFMKSNHFGDVQGRRRQKSRDAHEGDGQPEAPEHQRPNDSSDEDGASHGLLEVAQDEPEDDPYEGHGGDIYHGVARSAYRAAGVF